MKTKSRHHFQKRFRRLLKPPKRVRCGKCGHRTACERERCIRGIYQPVVECNRCGYRKVVDLDARYPEEARLRGHIIDGHDIDDI